jgi:hypothetical protein
MGEAYYRGIRGSAALATRRLRAEPVAAERLEAGELRRVPFAGELLGAVRVRAGYAALPLEAFDRISSVLAAEEQAAYLQLLRLAVGEGRNFCRAGKRDLMARLQLSERRLNRILDALVVRRFVKPLHRDNRGTLWRVYLPCEAFGEPLGDGVLLGRATPAAVPAPPLGAANEAQEAAPAAPRPGAARPRSQAAPARPARAIPETALARALAEARGDAGADAVEAAAREIRELLDEGQTPARIAASIETTRRRAAGAGAAKGLP